MQHMALPCATPRLSRVVARCHHPLMLARFVMFARVTERLLKTASTPSLLVCCRSCPMIVCALHYASYTVRCIYVFDQSIGSAVSWSVLLPRLLTSLQLHTSPACRTTCPRICTNVKHITTISMHSRICKQGWGSGAHVGQGAIVVSKQPGAHVTSDEHNTIVPRSIVRLRHALMDWWKKRMSLWEYAWAGLSGKGKSAC
jgi:hypothetical protein